MSWRIGVWLFSDSGVESFRGDSLPGWYSNCTADSTVWHTALHRACRCVNVLVFVLLDNVGEHATEIQASAIKPCPGCQAPYEHGVTPLIG
jgi:hypothetical protein